MYFTNDAMCCDERPTLRLVLTGNGTERLPAAAGVEARGAVTADELLSLYRRAACLVFPSVYEGFGQPPLEAMACGCPVACSDAASLPEVCGGAARLFDPSSPESIADAVDDVLRDTARYRRLGLDRARSFTWEATAQAHEQVYRDARQVFERVALREVFVEFLTLTAYAQLLGHPEHEAGRASV